MPTDSTLADVPPSPAPVPDDALAALMASPGFQEQMAALTQQAMAQVQALAAALRQIESQLPPPPPPPEDIPVGLAVPPVSEPWVMPPMPFDPPILTGGLDPKPTPRDLLPTDWLPLARSAVEPTIGVAAMPTAEEFATDMLAAPAPAPEPAIAAAAAPAAGSTAEAPMPVWLPVWLAADFHRAGAEGGIG